MEISAPADDSGWKLPEPVDDVMTFALPFTFDVEDRIAVLAFFHRYFLDRGEGSAGKVFAGVPRLGLHADPDPLADGGYIPQLTVTIWLKPFDLGVSQEMTIWLPVDPETHEYIARIGLRRLSGTRESWVRLSHGFVGQVRKHFLYWRAVSPSERQVMFEEARRLLESGFGEATLGAASATPPTEGGALSREAVNV